METIKLTVPITINNNTHETLIVRRPKVRDRLAVERIKKTDAEKEIVMIANLAEVTVDVIEELDLADYAKIQEVLQNFLELSPAISD
ncbi:MAG: phage tail assembly protein [Proteobacteria bacterium]|nr:phage tail assembly protein [Pseudomonadota bacterium]